MNKLLSKLKRLPGLRWKYLFYGSIVYVESGSSLTIGRNVKIRRAKIRLLDKSSMEIADCVEISHTLIDVSSSHVEVGKGSRIGRGRMPQKSQIWVYDKGHVVFGAYNSICPQRIWVRFGGRLIMGDYVFLNEFSEIRCDESVRIGSYTTFSYSVRIWDTNTHEIMSIQQRHERCRKLGLKWRMVIDRPKTKPVVIGEDSWFGERSVILKGTVIGNGCICGFGTLLSNKTIPDKTTVFSKNEIVMHANSL